MEEIKGFQSLQKWGLGLFLHTSPFLPLPSSSTKYTPFLLPCLQTKKGILKYVPGRSRS